MVDIVLNPLKHKVNVHNTKIFSSYLKENTMCIHYKVQLINAVQRNNCCLL
jgi:hypothetical protein